MHEFRVARLGLLGVLGVLGVPANEPALSTRFALFALFESDRRATIEFGDREQSPTDSLSPSDPRGPRRNLEVGPRVMEVARKSAGMDLGSVTEHPAFRTAFATAAAGSLLLAVIVLVLFVLQYLLVAGG